MLTDLCSAVGMLNYNMDASWFEQLEQHLQRAEYAHRDAGQLLRACNVLRYRMPENIVARVMRPVLQVGVWGWQVDPLLTFTPQVNTQFVSTRTHRTYAIVSR